MLLFKKTHQLVRHIVRWHKIHMVNKS